MTKIIDVMQSAIRSAGIRAQHKECFSNAFLTVVLEADVDLKYVEGFLVIPLKLGSYVIEHGWAEDEDGNILDVTPSTLQDAQEGKTTYASYFPALKWEREQAMAEFEASHQNLALPLWLHMDHKSADYKKYKAVEQEAYATLTPRDAQLSRIISESHHALEALSKEA